MIVVCMVLSLIVRTLNRESYHLGFICFGTTAKATLLPEFGLFPLPNLDSDMDFEPDSKPDGYIVLLHTCSHCTDLDFDAYPLFLHRTGIRIQAWQCSQAIKFLIFSPTISSLLFSGGTHFSNDAETDQRLVNRS